MTNGAIIPTKHAAVAAAIRQRGILCKKTCRWSYEQARPIIFNCKYIICDGNYEVDIRMSSTTMCIFLFFGLHFFIQYFDAFFSAVYAASQYDLNLSFAWCKNCSDRDMKRKIEVLLHKSRIGQLCPCVCPWTRTFTHVHVQVQPLDLVISYRRYDDCRTCRSESHRHAFLRQKLD
jgi:hypothetical protein